MCNTLLNKHLDEQTKELLGDPAIVRIVKFLDKASLSILELLEYGITEKEVNHALANSIMRFDRTLDKQSTDEYGAVTGGDYYYNFLNSKVRLTDIGLFILQNIQNK